MRLLPGAAAGLAELKNAGFELIVVSNQSAVARGLATPEDVSAIEDKIVALLAKKGVAIDSWYYCFHHPSAKLEKWRAICDCRKPAPGMLLRAAKERGIDLERSFLVGNMWSDILAANRAGVRAVMLATTPEKTALEASSYADEAEAWAIAETLYEAAKLIVEAEKRSVSRGTPPEVSPTVPAGQEARDRNQNRKRQATK